MEPCRIHEVLFPWMSVGANSIPLNLQFLQVSVMKERGSDLTWKKSQVWPLSLKLQILKIANFFQKCSMKFLHQTSDWHKATEKLCFFGETSPHKHALKGHLKIFIGGYYLKRKRKKKLTWRFVAVTYSAGTRISRVGPLRASLL